MTPRRPERRSEESARAIVQAALELCREVGYAKLSIEGIANRAGVGKNTIYRWWPSKSAVLLDGLLSAVSVQGPFPDTGDVVADFKTQMIAASSILASPDTGPHYAALIGEAQQDPALGSALWDRLVGHLVAAATERIRSAQQQGQIRPELDPEFVVELLYGPTYYRWLIRRHLPDPDHIRMVVDTAFAGIAPSGPAVG
ncbi:TetR/AcrR family transcriptional regulator [Streptomyces solicathayae]|uniref:TetR/AcrR family transcriptional regulator n=1 Tax=Streptomyces solicathayae TaxID=3081768 RepID=A0ABZ0M471_9ACTN|nr:TetR/AcrR family transcriptional regulator [Streptomyces sp. HUAS YS2]WOX26445.1 TetR/AcrR family transcriptional regulator [Streptomyces sp. HUAS YS2]